MCQRGFTLVETVVVVGMVGIAGSLAAVIGSGASAAPDVVAARLKQQTQAIQMYAADEGHYPPAYVFGALREGATWDMDDQGDSNPNPVNGYVHYSGLLVAGGYVDNESLFRSPAVEDGGAPRANPGQDSSRWEEWQINDLGEARPGSRFPSDRQAVRSAFTPNAAIMPRNKFHGSTPRLAELVPTADVLSSTRAILLTEWAAAPGPQGEAWKSLRTGDNVVKSHRPITPFLGAAGGKDVFNEPNAMSRPRFRYPRADEVLPDHQVGDRALVDTPSEVNAVARHYPGPAGGRAHFAFVSGEVELATLRDSLRKRWWGERFYSITGRDDVLR